MLYLLFVGRAFTTFKSYLRTWMLPMASSSKHSSLCAVYISQYSILSAQNAFFYNKTYLICYFWKNFEQKIQQEERLYNCNLDHQIFLDLQA